MAQLVHKNERNLQFYWHDFSKKNKNKMVENQQINFKKIDFFSHKIFKRFF